MSDVNVIFRYILRYRMLPINFICKFDMQIDLDVFLAKCALKDSSEVEIRSSLSRYLKEQDV